MRSFLFVPGDSERKLIKASSAGADALVLDLEDAVSDEQKPEARKLISAFLADRAATGDISSVFVRVNGVNTPHFEPDLEALGDVAPAGILLPKATSVGDVELADKKISDLESSRGTSANSLRVIAMVTETPQSILNMGQYMSVPDRVSGFAWSGEDLAASLGAKDNRDDAGGYTDPYRIARAMSLMAAAAAGVQPIDAVYTDFRDHDGLKAETEAAARDGFTGKLAIHPAQVEIINEAFTPNDMEIEDAQAVISAFGADDKIGVIGLKNKMMDLPNLIMARNTLERAKLAGKL